MRLPDLRAVGWGVVILDVSSCRHPREARGRSWRCSCLVRAGELQAFYCFWLLAMGFPSAYAGLGPLEFRQAIIGSWAPRTPEEGIQHPGSATWLWHPREEQPSPQPGVAIKQGVGTTPLRWGHAGHQSHSSALQPSLLAV